MAPPHENDTPGKETLPAWQSMEECRAYCAEKNDSFYFTAFLFECWTGIVVTGTAEEYAMKKSGKRNLQTGLGWKAWRHVFGHATPDEWSHILSSQARFSRCDTPEAALVAQVQALIVLEDKFGEPVSLSVVLEKGIVASQDFPELLKRMRYLFRRMAEWMEALVHWDAHWKAAVIPMTFGLTARERELADIGIMQAGFSGLSEHAKDWWRFRHDDLAQKLAGRPEWRIVGKAQSIEKFGELRQPVVDELTILWWPLLIRYHWTDRDMRLLLRGIAPHPDAYPLREDKEFADYRKKALGLAKTRKERDKSSDSGEPMGWQVAMAMVQKLSE